MTTTSPNLVAVRDHHLAATAFGAAAILGGSTALTPLLEGLTWLQPLATVVGVIWLIGAGTRLAGLPGWTTPAAQLLGFIAALAALFTTSGVAGLGGAAWREGTELFGLAWDQVMTTVPPAPVTTALAFLIALTVGLLAVLVDLLISATNLPAMTAIPLLALYSVPASIASDLLPWYAFVIPIVCYAGILATSRGAVSMRATTSGAVTAALITALAIGSATVITHIATGIGTDGRIPHSGRAGGEVSLNPWALLRGDLTSRTPTDVLTVGGISRPDYLRTLALERWVPDKGFVPGALTPDIPDFDGTIPHPAGQSSSERARITPIGYRDKYLPIFLGAREVDGVGSGWAYDASVAAVFRDTPTSPAPYTVSLPAQNPTAKRLRADDVLAQPAELTAIDGVSDQTVLLAKRITAGATSDFDKVTAILDYFTDPANGFEYSLATPPGNSGSALTDFLTTRSGYCEQYAAAMAIMVRTLGIPTRVGMGFTQGTLQSDGSYLVESTNAHAWVEVPFAGVGWVSFDPTPPVGGQGGLQGFRTGGDASGQPADATQTSAPAPASSSAAPLTPQLSRTIPDLGAPSRTPAEAAAQPGFVREHLPDIAIGVLAAAAVALLLGAPTLVRRRRRSRRLRVAGSGGTAGAEAAWREIADSAVDHGISFAPSATARDRSNVLARHAHLTSMERSSLKAVVTTVERSWYGDGHDSATADHEDFTLAAHAVADGLARASTRSRWDRYWPRSIRPQRR